MGTIALHPSTGSRTRPSACYISRAGLSCRCMGNDMTVDMTPPLLRTEKQLTAPADRPLRDPAHAVAFTTAAAIGGAGSVHRRTGIKTARTLPVDRNGAGSPPATNCAQNPPPALPVNHARDSPQPPSPRGTPTWGRRGGEDDTERTARARGVSRGELRAWFPLTR